MYKKLALTIFLFIPLFSAYSMEFVEGEHYLEIKGTLTKNKEITEFFSFYCPACFRQEPFMNDLKASMPEGATFKKNHVSGMPGRNPEIEQLLTKALITAKHLKVESVLVPAIFDTIHLNRSNFNSAKDIKKLFEANGVDGDKFDKTFSSFAVKANAKKMHRNTDNIRRQGFSGVPTLIVNGKYKPLTNNLKSMQEYKALVMYLLNKAG